MPAAYGELQSRPTPAHLGTNNWSLTEARAGVCGQALQQASPLHKVKKQSQEEGSPLSVKDRSQDSNSSCLVSKPWAHSILVFQKGTQILLS